MVDRRALGWEPLRGPSAVAAICTLVGRAVPDIELRFETLAGDEEHIAVPIGGYGHAADGGGAMEYAAARS